jgi:hypothetical protein
MVPNMFAAGDADARAPAGPLVADGVDVEDDDEDERRLPLHAPAAKAATVTRPATRAMVLRRTIVSLVTPSVRHRFRRETLLGRDP